MANTSVKTPQPRIKPRPIDPAIEQAALDAGYPAVVARVLAGRPVAAADVPNGIAPGLSQLDHYQGLPDIEKAAERLATAIEQQAMIAIETDHDVDGVTSHAVIRRALVEDFGHPREHINGYIGHRLRDGYGLSEPVAQRILDTDPQPAVVITADNGSSDEPRIAKLAKAGIDVIVTDHHELPIEGPPASAYACITPKHPDNTYPDTAIAGCMVAWLLMCAVRAKLLERQPSRDIPPLGHLLDYVAVGTVADCVSLARSRNNRAVVLAGLRQINQLQRPCWQAIRENLWNDGPLTAEDLAFGIGPRINARGRLDEAMAGVEFLLADAKAEAEVYAELLEGENNERKTVERRLKETAMAIGAEQYAAGKKAIVAWLPEGHAGVHGIVASRLVEAFGCPAVCLSPKEGTDEWVSGSARGIPGFHVRDALQVCADAHPDLFAGFGGHEGAGGLTIRRDGIEQFGAAYQHVADQQLGGEDIGPVILTDGPLAAGEMGTETVEALQVLDPYGREFEAPLFSGEFTVAEIKPVGADRTHMKVMLTTDDGGQLPAIWFQARENQEQPIPASQGDRVEVVYELTINHFRNRITSQGRIKALRAIL